MFFIPGVCTNKATRVSNHPWFHFIQHLGIPLLSSDTQSSPTRIMPELPEVETSRAYVENFCRGSKIMKCHTFEQGGGPVSVEISLRSARSEHENLDVMTRPTAATRSIFRIM